MSHSALTLINSSLHESLTNHVNLFAVSIVSATISIPIFYGTAMFIPTVLFCQVAMTVYEVTRPILQKLFSDYKQDPSFKNIYHLIHGAVVVLLSKKISSLLYCPMTYPQVILILTIFCVSLRIVNFAIEKIFAETLDQRCAESLPFKKSSTNNC